MVDLGTYAGPVLLAYGATFGLLTVLVVASVTRARRVKRDLAAMEARNA
jgi:heme exporter protein D